MPFTISAGFQTALDAGTTSLALALRVVRADGQVFAFTNFQRRITLPSLTIGTVTIPSTTYDPRTALVPTNLSQSSDPTKVDNWEVTGPVGDVILEGDVRKDLFRNAKYSLIIFNWKDTSQQMLRVRGTVGMIALDGEMVTLKMRSLAQVLTQEILWVTSPLSRAKWGDAQMSFFNLGGNTSDGYAARVNSTINSVSSPYARRRFTVNATINFPARRFVGGTAKWTSGLNNGFEAEIMDWNRTTGEITLVKNAPYAITAGDSVRCQIVCPITIEDWYIYFGSNRYFAGEAGVATIEQANEVKRQGN